MIVRRFDGKKTEVFGIYLDVHLLCIISDRYFKMTHESHADKWKSNLEMHILLQLILSVFFEDAFFLFSVFFFSSIFFVTISWKSCSKQVWKKTILFFCFFVSLFLFFSLCTFTKIWFVFETSLVAYDDLGTSNFFHDFSWFQFWFFGILGL